MWKCVGRGWASRYTLYRVGNVREDLVYIGWGWRYRVGIGLKIAYRGNRVVMGVKV